MYLSPIGNASFTGSDGKPYAGGQIWTYLSGSTTPRITYQDVAGTAPHENPIILNSMGEPPGPIFLDEGAYRFVRKDSTGLQIGLPIDGISGVVGETTGEFTPVFAGNTVAGTQTYGARSGRYSIRGSRGRFEIYIRLTAKDAATSGPLRITGFPFNTINIANAYTALCVSNWKFNIGTSYSQLGAFFVPNTSQIQLTKNGNNVSNISVDSVDLLADSEIMISGEVELA